MSEMHLFLLGFTIGALFMWGIFYIIHRYSVKQIETTAIKGLEDLGQVAKRAIQDLADSMHDSLKK